MGTGFGTDEEAVIWVLGHRNASQRRKIRDTYQQLYNKSLIDLLYSELSGDFRVIFYYSLCFPFLIIHRGGRKTPKFYCHCGYRHYHVNHSFKGHTKLLA